MENYTDYDVHESIQALAASLGISITGQNDCVLIDQIDDRCREAADILREKVFSKDIISDYLKRNPYSSTREGLIIVDGDSKLTEFWEKQVILASGLKAAVRKCNSESPEDFE